MQKPRNIQEIMKRCEELGQRTLTEKNNLTEKKEVIPYDIHESCSIDIININHEVMNHESLRLKKILLNQLLEWRVYFPEKLINNYGLYTIREAVERTKFNKTVKIPGAYFKTVLKSIA